MNCARARAVSVPRRGSFGGGGLRVRRSRSRCRHRAGSDRQLLPLAPHRAAAVPTRAPIRLRYRHAPRNAPFPHRGCLHCDPYRTRCWRRHSRRPASRTVEVRRRTFARPPSEARFRAPSTIACGRSCAEPGRAPRGCQADVPDGQGTVTSPVEMASVRREP